MPWLKSKTQEKDSVLLVMYVSEYMAKSLQNIIIYQEME